MYFNKDDLLFLYKKLSSLYSGNDIEAQGGTQFVSELRYFLATDEFKKNKGHACDTKVKEDKDLFIKYVGSLVYLSYTDSGTLLSTKNFSKSIGESKDFNVGSNFFSVNVVKSSMLSDIPLRFPERHAQLLTVTKGVLDIPEIGYSNIANSQDYLGNSIVKFSILFLWLNRYNSFDSAESLYSKCLHYLETKYSVKLITSLKWNTETVKTEINKMIQNFSFSDTPYYLGKNDFISEKETKSNIGSIMKSHNRIIFGSPGTGKSHKLKEESLIFENDIERVTFHPNYSYAQFVGTYKPTTTQETIVSSLSDENQQILAVLTDKNKTGQERYDLLYEKFKGDNLTRLPLLLGIYTDDLFKTKKADGSPTADDNMPARNNGKAIRPFVNINTRDSSGKIAYEYVPGPFIRTYIKAKKTGQNVLLLIEEINRANVAAVFGDVFQLLDRDANGNSEYPITTSEDLRNFLARPENLGGTPDDYKTLSIPSNMYIWATMNSADQGVLPMDAAFKRRWDFEYIGIDEKETWDYVIPLPKGKSINWNVLRKAINAKLKTISGVNEDKLLGPYFLSKSVLEHINGNTNKEEIEKFINTFKSKVLMYLFEDVCKMRPTDLFKNISGLEQNQTRPHYSDICKNFDQKGIAIFDLEEADLEKYKEISNNNSEDSSAEQ